MKIRTVCRTFLAAVASAAFALVLSGCDDGGGDPDTSGLDNYFATHPYVSDPRTSGSSGVDVTPDSASINTVGGQQLFTVTGGAGGYTWDVSNSSMGQFIHYNSDKSQATYEALGVGVNDVIVYDSQGNAAIAKIGGTPPEGMKITADPSTITDNYGLSILTVEGGSPVYTWTCTDQARGLFPEGTTGSTVMYQRISAGDNGITVTDGLGNKTSIVIKQP